MKDLSLVPLSAAIRSAASRLWTRELCGLSKMLAWFVLLDVCGGAQGADRYVGRCDVVFKVDSTLHAFTGDITNIALVVFRETNPAGAAVLNTRIEIAPQRLTTHHKKRDADMYKMFQPELYPKLLAVVTNAPLAAANLAPGGPASRAGHLPVLLTFCGVTREVQARILNPQPQADGWTFDLVTEVSLKAFHLKPSSALFGTLTVRDIVVVEAHVTVRKEAAKP
jgi:hypothetical protein